MLKEKTLKNARILIASLRRKKSYLVPVCFIQDWSGEDDDIEDDAETVEDRECGDESEEAGLEVEGGRGDDTERHQVS